LIANMLAQPRRESCLVEKHCRKVAESKEMRASRISGGWPARWDFAGGIRSVRSVRATARSPFHPYANSGPSMFSGSLAPMCSTLRLQLEPR